MCGFMNLPWDWANTGLRRSFRGTAKRRVRLSPDRDGAEPGTSLSEAKRSFLRE